MVTKPIKTILLLLIDGKKLNITENWDGTVNSFSWDEKGEKIYFIAPNFGTVQLFEIKVPTSSNKITQPKQLTNGQFDVSGIVGQV